MAGETFGSQIWISRNTGICNGLMFTHPPLMHSWSLGTIEASIALGMIRELGYQGHNTGTSIGNKTHMEKSVRNLPAFVLFGSRQPGHLGKAEFEHLQAISLEDRNSQTNGQGLQRDTCGIQLLKIRNGEVCHADAMVGFSLNQPFVLQHAQGFAQ